MVIVELGIHRAGTSLAANWLDALGVDMGQRFAPASAINPYGYYEDLDFQELNAAILKQAGGSWYEPPTPVQIRDASVAFDVAGLIRCKDERSALWGWKDPCTALTYQLYKPHLDDVRIVHVVRDWDEIAVSLHTWYSYLRVDWKKLIRIYDYYIRQHLASTPDDWIYRLRFEDMVTKSRARRVAAGLAGFVGADLGQVSVALARTHFRYK